LRIGTDARIGADARIAADLRLTTDVRIAADLRIATDVWSCDRVGPALLLVSREIDRLGVRDRNPSAERPQIDIPEAGAGTPLPLECASKE
jgi:hypothetical protein